MRMLKIGWIFASITGAIVPSFIWMIGDVFDSYNPANDPSETRDKIRIAFCKILGLCVLICITATIYYYLLVAASHMITTRIKKLYLEAILRQESAWFDTQNYTELPSRVIKECQSIQRGIGEKFGQIIFSISMFMSGLVVGSTKGGSLAAAMLAVGPIIFTGIAVFAVNLAKRTMIIMKSYVQSAGYAE